MQRSRCGPFLVFGVACASLRPRGAGSGERGDCGACVEHYGMREAQRGQKRRRERRNGGLSTVLRRTRSARAHTTHPHKTHTHTCTHTHTQQTHTQQAHTTEQGQTRQRLVSTVSSCRQLPLSPPSLPPSSPPAPCERMASDTRGCPTPASLFAFSQVVRPIPLALTFLFRRRLRLTGAANAPTVHGCGRILRGHWQAQDARAFFQGTLRSGPCRSCAKIEHEYCGRI